jgi:hypothetical protein
MDGIWLVLGWIQGYSAKNSRRTVDPGKVHRRAHAVSGSIPSAVAQDRPSVNGGFPWLKTRCARCKTPGNVDLPAGNRAMLGPKPDRCAISIRSRPTKPPSARCFASSTDIGNLAPMPGVFPDYMAPIVRTGATRRELATARWGMPSSQPRAARSGWRRRDPPPLLFRRNLGKLDVGAEGQGRRDHERPLRVPHDGARRRSWRDPSEGDAGDPDYAGGSGDVDGRSSRRGVEADGRCGSSRSC